MNGDEVWKRIIVSKYGENVVGSTRLEVNGGGGDILASLGGRIYVGWMRVLGGLTMWLGKNWGGAIPSIFGRIFGWVIYLLSNVFRYFLIFRFNMVL
jgi:hypothetical protein